MQVFFFYFYINNIYIGHNTNHFQLNNLIFAPSQNPTKIGQNKLNRHKPIRIKKAE